MYWDEKNENCVYPSLPPVTLLKGAALSTPVPVPSRPAVPPTATGPQPSPQVTLTCIWQQGGRTRRYTFDLSCHFTAPKENSNISQKIQPSLLKKLALKYHYKVAGVWLRILCSQLAGHDILIMGGLGLSENQPFEHIKLSTQNLKHLMYQPI